MRSRSCSNDGHSIPLPILGGREDSVEETNAAQIESRINYSASSINCDPTLLWSSSWRVFDKRGVAELTYVDWWRDREEEEEMDGLGFSEIGVRISLRTLGINTTLTWRLQARSGAMSRRSWSISLVIDARCKSFEFFPRKIRESSSVENNPIGEEEVDWELENVRVRAFLPRRDLSGFPRRLRVLDN